MNLETLRSYRISIDDDTTIALFDLLASFIGMELITQKGFSLPFGVGLLLTLPTSYLAHELFKQETPLNKKINNSYGKITEVKYSEPKIKSCNKQ